jgi:hypothetical protein
MDLTEGSETSAKLNLRPGKYPKENIQDSEHDETLKSRKDTNITKRFRFIYLAYSFSTIEMQFSEQDS